jgi:phosphoribosylanthranilate isomerase
MKIKICGITTPEGLLAADAAGADFVGLVFYEKSPRHLTLEQAAILSKIPLQHAKIVALTVDAEDSFLGEICERVNVHALQLHGAETPERVDFVRKKFQRTVIKAVGIATKDDLITSKTYQHVADWLLLDAKPVAGDMHGGNNKSFDWAVLQGFQSQTPWLLAGGLNPHNIANAILQTKPDGVDVSSGVERVRGVKDSALIANFIENVRASVLYNLSQNKLPRL